MDSKPFWKSKTIWLNVIGAALWGGQQLSGKNIVPDKYLLPAMTLLNVILRSISSGALTTTTTIDPPKAVTILVLALSLSFLCGCASTDNRNMTPGGSGWQSTYRVNLKAGTFEANNSKDNSIAYLHASAATNGAADVVISNAVNKVNSDAVQGATAANQALIEIIKAQGEANAKLVNALGDLAIKLGTAAGAATGTAAHTAATGTP